MKALVRELREIELGRVDLASASPLDLFDLEAALVFALAEVRKRRAEVTPLSPDPTNGVRPLITSTRPAGGATRG